MGGRLPAANGFATHARHRWFVGGLLLTAPAILTCKAARYQFSIHARALMRGLCAARAQAYSHDSCWQAHGQIAHVHRKEHLSATLADAALLTYNVNCKKK